MNLNLIFEEVKVDNFEGEIEIFKTVKRGERIETKVDKKQYKLQRESSISFLEDFQKIESKYNFFKRNFFEKFFSKRDTNHLIKFISKESENFSWILSPKNFYKNLKDSNLFTDKLIFEFDSCDFILGNFDSATIIKNGEFCHILQNSPLKLIKIN
jgi:hypothetical protein